MVYELLKLLETPVARTIATTTLATLSLRKAGQYLFNQWWGAARIDLNADYIIREAEEVGKGLGMDIDKLKTAPLNASKNRIGSLFIVNAERATVVLPGKKGQPDRISVLNFGDIDVTNLKSAATRKTNQDYTLLQAYANLDNPEKVFETFKSPPSPKLPSSRKGRWRWLGRVMKTVCNSWARPNDRHHLWRGVASEIFTSRAQKVDAAMQLVAKVLANANRGSDFRISSEFHIGLKTVDTEGQSHIIVAPKTNFMKKILFADLNAGSMRDKIAATYREQAQALTAEVEKEEKYMPSVPALEQRPSSLFL